MQYRSLSLSLSVLFFLCCLPIFHFLLSCVIVYPFSAPSFPVWEQEFLPYLREAAKSSGEPGMSCSKAAVINISTILASIAKVPETVAFFPVFALPYRISKVLTDSPLHFYLSLCLLSTATASMIDTRRQWSVLARNFDLQNSLEVEVDSRMI